MIPDFKGHHFEKTLASGQQRRGDRYCCTRCGMTAGAREDAANFVIKAG